MSAYGGFLASLCATLLWDVMNADPLVVHHAHDSGLASTLNEHLDSLASAHVSLRNVLYSTSSHSNMLQVGDDLVLIGLLSEIPQLPINVLQEKNENKEELTSLACFLRQFSVAEWFVNLITAVLRIASQRCQDISHAWSGSERDSGWKAVICSPSFAKTLKRITSFSVGSQLEACRIRTTAGFDERDIERHNPPLGCNPWYPYKYLLRIINCSSLVCPSTWNERHLDP